MDLGSGQSLSISVYNALSLWAGMNDYIHEAWKLERKKAVGVWSRGNAEFQLILYRLVWLYINSSLVVLDLFNLFILFTLHIAWFLELLIY